MNLTKSFKTTLCGIVLMFSGVGLTGYSCSNLPHPNTKAYEIKQSSKLEQFLYLGGVTSGFIVMGAGLHLINKGLSSRKKNNYQ